MNNKNVATKKAILKDGTAPIPQEIQICTLNWHECIFFSRFVLTLRQRKFRRRERVIFTMTDLALFSFSFAVLPLDTPSTDSTSNYITPSPTANECQLPKAPKARKVIHKQAGAGCIKK